MEKNDEQRKAEEVKAEERKISIFTLSAPQSPVAAALQNISRNSLGYEVDKQIYRLRKEIRSKCEEYTELCQKILKTQGTQKGNLTFLEGQGLKDFNALNADVGVQEVVLENVPIEIKALPAGVAAGDMILLEDAGIFIMAEEEEEEKREQNKKP